MRSKKQPESLEERLAGRRKPTQLGRMREEVVPASLLRIIPGTDLSEYMSIGGDEIMERLGQHFHWTTTVEDTLAHIRLFAGDCHHAQ